MRKSVCQTTMSAHTHTGVACVCTYLNGEAVGEEGKEPREANHGEVDGELNEVCHELRHALLDVVEQHEQAHVQGQQHW